MRKITTEEFITKANKIHNNFFDYSKVEYNGMSNKIIVIDPEYGEFSVSPDNHLRRKSGHPKRSFDKNRITKEEFIIRSNIIHNNLYDYSKVNFSTVKDKITIIDPIHGEFTQRVSNHLSGQGHFNRLKERLSSNTNEFISKANKIHNNFFDYSKVDYINSYTFITIIDPEYGEFTMTPSYHLAGGKHPKRSMTGQELDHIIPLSFVCKSSERNKFKEDPLYRLLDMDINKVKIDGKKNRSKSDSFILFGKKELARDYRGDIDLIRYMFRRQFGFIPDLIKQEPK